MTFENISMYYWWHTIDLGNNVVTPGHKSAALMQQEASLFFTQWIYVTRHF